MSNKIKNLFNGKLIRASSFLLTGGIVSGFLGYLFQIIMGRMLSVSEYGIFATIMAIFVLIGAPLGTLSMLVSRKVSAYRSIQYAHQRAYFFFMVHQKLIIASVISVITILFFLESIQHFLSIEDSINFYLLILLLLVAFPLSVNNAYLQGLQYFKWLSLSGVLATSLKIIIAVLLINLGFGVSGAIGGVALSSFVILILTYVILRPSLNKVANNSNKKINLSFKVAIPVFIANVSFLIMTQIDMVVVKHYFSSQDAGIYAAASTLGKAVMYLPGGIAMALFPMVAEKHAEGESSANFLIQATVLTFLLCSIGALFYYFYSFFFVVLIFGEEYMAAAEILKYFGFAMIPMALIMVAEHFLIAIGKVLFAYLFMIIAPLQLVAIYYYHDTFLNILTITAITGLVLTIIGYIVLWRFYKNEKKPKL